LPLCDLIVRVKFALSVAAFALGLAAGSATAARAHALIKPESFDATRIVPHRAVSVELRFNAAIHAALTRVILLDAGGNETPLTSRPGDGPNRLIVDFPPLAPGVYALRYRALAADGHYTDNALRFQVGEK
jgi:methionine-rich copper-binding protein CopC